MFKNNDFGSKNYQFLGRKIILKILNSHFYPLCDAFHQNLINRFSERLKRLDFDHKMTHFPHFGYNKNFP